jgi:hypothetical protein
MNIPSRNETNEARKDVESYANVQLWTLFNRFYIRADSPSTPPSWSVELALHSIDSVLCTLKQFLEDQYSRLCGISTYFLSMFHHTTTVATYSVLILHHHRKTTVPS